MKRRLLVVNGVLLVAAGIGLWRFRVEYRQSQERYRVLTPPRAPVPPAVPTAQLPPPVQPAAYFDAAQKYLFSPDRNPNVAVEPPKVKPRPPLPVLFGVMNLGTGPIALMAANATGAHKPIRIGEPIGDFKLVAAAGDKITLEWEGEKIHAQVSDLLVKQPAAGAPQQAAGTANAGGTLSGAAALAPAPTVVTPAGRPGEYAVGGPIEGRPGTYYAPPVDSAPPGTVFQNKRKVLRQTPFGSQAWWEDVK